MGPLGDGLTKTCLSFPIYSGYVSVSRSGSVDEHQS